MGLLQLATAAVALLASAATAAPAAPAAKYCEGDVCYTEFVSPQNVAFRAAIPNTATAAPFDILLQIVAPKTVGWAAIAWGGQMANNPLTLAYSNGAGGAIASSRWANGRVAPQMYTGASYTVFPSSTTNATHWRLDALCSGCSQWTASGRATGLNPAGSIQIAWGMTSRMPATPSSNTSTISIHEAKARISFDLAAGKIANFAQVVAAKKGPAPAV